MHIDGHFQRQNDLKGTFFGKTDKKVEISRTIVAIEVILMSISLLPVINKNDSEVARMNFQTHR